MMRIWGFKRGFALAFSLIVMTSVILSVNTFFEIAGSGLKTANKTADTKRAYYLADAGLAYAFIQLKNNPAVHFPITNNYVIGDKTGTYSVDKSSNSAAWPTLTLTSTGTYNGVNKTLQLSIQQGSASMMAYLSNSEIHPTWGRLWWITGMYTVGPVHTNGQLNIWGDPIFNGAVSQSAASVNYWPDVITDPNDFMGGLTLGAPPKNVFNNTILNNISSAAASTGGLLLSGDSAVTFNADGSINVTNSVRGWNNKNMAAPVNKAIYVQSGSATVKGTVNGQITLGADNTIYISNNIKYNSNPDPVHPNLLSTDLVSLVAHDNIVVQAATAPANVVIEGVLVAINGSFQVDNWWAQGKGNMLQYGALINNVCGPTGVFDPGTGTLYGGYNQLQYYDARLDPTIEPGRVNLVPPYFPATTDSTGRIEYNRINFKEL